MGMYVTHILDLVHTTQCTVPLRAWLLPSALHLRPAASERHPCMPNHVPLDGRFTAGSKPQTDGPTRPSGDTPHTNTRTHARTHTPTLPYRPPPPVFRIHRTHCIHTYIIHHTLHHNITHHTVCSCCVLLRRGAVRYCAGVILRGGP